MNPNKFKGQCAACGKTVPARAGVLVGNRGNWKVYCQDHAHQAATSQAPAHVPDRFDMMIEDQMRDACGC